MSNVSFSSNSESKMKNYDYSPFYDGTNSEYFISQRNQLESSNNDIFDLWVYFNLFPFGEQERDNFDEDNRYYISPTSYITDNDRRENIFSIFKDKTNRLNNDLKKYQYKKRGRKKKDEFNKNLAFLFPFLAAKTSYLLFMKFIVLSMKITFILCITLSCFDLE